MTIISKHAKVQNFFVGLGSNLYASGLAIHIIYYQFLRIFGQILVK